MKINIKNTIFLSSKIKQKITFLNNKPKKPLTFAQCIHPIYVISRLFGLLPFSVHLNSNGNVERARIKIFDIAWFLCAISINLFLAYFILTRKKNSLEIESKVLMIGNYIIFSITFIMAPLSIILDMFNRHRLVKMFKDIMEFDKTVR